MFARLGLVLLIVVFGACTFVAGTMAPDTWRQPIGAFGGWVLGRATAPGGAAGKSGASKVASGAAALEPAPLVAVKSAGPPAPGAAPAPPPLALTPAPAPVEKTTAPVRLDSLLVTAAVASLEPAAGQPAYALQLGQFATDEEAQAASRRFQAAGLGLPLIDLVTLDSANEPWSVVAMGQFPTPEAARREAPRVQNVLNIADTPVIRLPAAPKPSS